MKKQFSLSINNPCSVDESNFTPTPNGRFCSACSKNVIDFSRMSEQEIISFFSKRPDHVCGRFRQDQLKSYSLHQSYAGNLNLKWMHTGFLSLLLVLTSRHVIAGNNPPKRIVESSQEQEKQSENKTLSGSSHIIKGAVVDNITKDGIPGVVITLMSDTAGTVTDIDGRFEFPKELEEGDTLVIAYTGYEVVNYIIPKSPEKLIEIQLTMTTLMADGEVSINEVYSSKKSGISLWWRRFNDLF